MESDRGLVDRVVAKDSSAFEVLVDRYGPLLREHLRRIVRCDATAEDLQQEVLLRLWTRCDQWTGQGTIKAWLMRTATNLALNHLRTVRRRRQQPLEPPPAGESDDESVAPGWMVDASALAPQEAAEIGEQRELLATLVNELPEQQQEMLHQVYDEGQELVQVAQFFGVPVGTIKSRLHYTIKRLGRQWSEIYFDRERR